ncbi:MAG: type II toxin-antitoxin system VapC family toxin [Candidatus Bathyarchaeota archaeon]|nr:type II toxin-antitoxin system VapC family toxin [Candidatus Bathyarchaeota archaeon]
MLYLDANIFIFAALNTENEGPKAVALLDQIQSGEEKAVTSALTFDEVFWEVKRNRGMEKALETAEALLNFPNLEIIAANKELALSALRLIREVHLAPRDALHASTAIAEKVDYVVTSDAHFGKIKELKIKGL